MVQLTKKIELFNYEIIFLSAWLVIIYTGILEWSLSLLAIMPINVHEKEIIMNDDTFVCNICLQYSFN